MPNRGLFGNYEEKYKNKAREVSLEVKGMLPLDDYLRGQSVINDSVGSINNMESSMGNSEVKQKTLVRRMDNPYSHMGASTLDERDSIPREYVGGSSLGYSDDNVWNNRTGFSQTLILIMTAILVVIVVGVSLVVMNYIGL